MIVVNKKRGGERHSSDVVSRVEIGAGTTISMKFDRAISKLLVGRELTPIKIRAKIREGLPITSINRVSKALHDKDTDRVLRLVGMKERTYQRHKKNNSPLSPVQSDRLYRIAKFEERAVEVFGDRDIANDWLNASNRVIGSPPLDALDTEAGAEMVEHVLLRIEYGVYS